MSKAPEPPARESSKAFSELYRQRKEAEETKKAAKRSTDSLASWDSAQYWYYRKQSSQASLVITEVENEIEKQKTGSEAQDYQKRKREFEEESESADRKIRRYNARARIVEAAKTTNPTSIRASFLELMLSVLSKTSRANQSNFTRDLAERYGTKSVGKFKYVWSPVKGDWVMRGSVKAAHLFPLALGQATMTYIFGSETDHELNRAQNGLFLDPNVEEIFDKHLLTIVPFEEGSPDWKIIILDRSGIWNSPAPFLGENKTGADLHNLKLVFQPGNPFRPRARYLYFHYVMAMLKIGRSSQKEKAGHSSHMAEVTTPALTKVWGTQGRYLRDNMIRAFIEGIGHDDGLPVDPDDMMSHALEPIPNEVTSMIETSRFVDLESEDEDSDED